MHRINLMNHDYIFYNETVHIWAVRIGTVNIRIICSVAVNIAHWNKLKNKILAFYQADIYRVSHFIGNSKFGIKIIFDGRVYGAIIFRTVSYVIWL